jgi:hypothetical protein
LNQIKKNSFEGVQGSSRAVVLRITNDNNNNNNNNNSNNKFHCYVFRLELMNPAEKPSKIICII